MSSISCHSLAVDEISSTISRGRVQAAIYTNPTVLQASILRLATRFRYLVVASFLDR